MAVFTKSAAVLDSAGIDLEATLFCGQTFSWRAVGGGVFCGTAGPRAVYARAEDNGLVLENCSHAPLTGEDLAFWRGYFAVDGGQQALLERFCEDETLGACVRSAPGVRLLNQPFFDTLLSFIISQNNNIPRITGIVERLRETFGEDAGGGVRAFPTAQRLAACTPEDLAPLRAGFRARYLVDAARQVAKGRVDEAKLAAMEDGEARGALMQITGVGPKVADCVLLYGLGRHGVVPMDVWMKRAMAQAFPGGMPKEATGYEGLAQLYVFCWVRAAGRGGQ